MPYRHLWSSRTSTGSIRREFKKHLLSIGTSLKETNDSLNKTDTWNKYIDKETHTLSGPDCNSGLYDGRIEYVTMREPAEILEDTLKKNAPSEIDKVHVVTWEYEISSSNEVSGVNTL